MIILYAIVAIIIVILIVALFVKKDYEVVRKIIINQPVNVVFDYIKYLKNQDHFSKWATMDPDMKKEYKGTDGEEGFVSAWQSNNKKVGQGEQSIRRIKERKKMEWDLHFIKPFEGRANAWMTTNSLNLQETEVTWEWIAL